MSDASLVKLSFLQKFDTLNIKRVCVVFATSTFLMHCLALRENVNLHPISFSTRERREGLFCSREHVRREGHVIVTLLINRSFIAIASKRVTCCDAQLEVVSRKSRGI